MNAITVIEPMTRSEAELCLAEIGTHFSSAALLARDLDHRLGWKVLGYDDLRSCLVDRLGRHAYRILKLTDVLTNITALSPTGETPHDLRERHVRDSKLGELPPAQQLEAYQIAKTIAATEKRPLSSAHVTQAVAQVQTKATVFQSRYFVVSNLVATGKSTAVQGKAMVDALDKLPPKKRGYLVQLIAQFELTSPALFEPIAFMFDRPSGHESKVLDEVKTGYLGGVPLKQATFSDLRRANEEARREHLADELERKRLEQPQVEPLIITVYKGDPVRSLRALRDALGDELYSIRDLLLQE